MKVSEKIVAAQEFIQEKKSAINALLATADAEGRDMTPEEAAQSDEYASDVESKTAELGTLQRAEKALALREASLKDARQAVPMFRQASKPEDILFQIASAHLVSHQAKSSIEDAIQKLYGNSELAMQLKTAVSPAQTDVAGWASELVQQGISGFMDTLKATSVYAQLASAGISINFGNNGSVVVPGWGSGNGLSGSFVGEADPIPVKKSAITSKTLYRYKMAVISTFSKELQRSSTPQIEGLIRQKMSEDTSQALDVALLDVGPAVTGVRPASILNGAPTKAAAGTTIDNIIADLQWLLNNLTTQNAGRRPVLIMHPSRALGLSMKTNSLGQFMFQTDINSGRLFGAQLVTSTYVSTSVVALVDAADFATAFGVPEFELSDVATIVEANDDGTPPNVDTVSGAVNATPVGPVRSLFQTWTTAIRMVMPLSWAQLRPTAAYLTGVAW